MKHGEGFAQGVGAGAGLILFSVAALFLTSRGRRPLLSILRKMEDAARSGRSPWTGEPRANYLDMCRSAGL